MSLGKAELYMLKVTFVGFLQIYAESQEQNDTTMTKSPFALVSKPRDEYKRETSLTLFH